MSGSNQNVRGNVSEPQGSDDGTRVLKLPSTAARDEPPYMVPGMSSLGMHFVRSLTTA
jgi:hypothetical protein